MTSKNQDLIDKEEQLSQKSQSFVVEHYHKPFTSWRYYIFPWNGQTYDTSSYHPRWSDGVITEQDMARIRRKIHGVFLLEPAGTTPRFGFVCALAVFFTGIAGVFFILKAPVMYRNPRFIIGGCIAVLIIFGLIVYLLYWFYSKIYTFVRNKQFQEVFQQLQFELLDSKNVTIGLSPSSSYLYIYFNFRAQYHDTLLN